MNEPAFLCADAILLIHQQQVARFGGPYGLRDTGALHAVLSHSRKTWSYTGNPYETAAQYYFSLLHHRPFYGGNRRAGVACMLVFLTLNGIEPAATQQQLGEWLDSCVTGSGGREDLAAALRQAQAPG